MAAPTWVSNGTFVEGVGGNATVGYPASPQADDIIFLFVHANSSPTIGSVTGSFSAVGAQVDSGTHGARLYWLRATGSETGNVTVTISGNTVSGAVMSLFRGAITSGTPYEDYDTAASTGSTSTSASITTSVDETLGIRWGGNVNASAGNPPDGWDERFENTASGGADMTIDTNTIETATTEAATSRSLGSSMAWIVLTLALKPPAAAAGQPYAKRMGGVQCVQDFRRGQGTNLWRKASELLLPRPSIIRI